MRKMPMSSDGTCSGCRSQLEEGYNRDWLGRKQYKLHRPELCIVMLGQKLSEHSTSILVHRHEIEDLQQRDRDNAKRIVDIEGSVGGPQDNISKTFSLWSQLNSHMQWAHDSMRHINNKLFPIITKAKKKKASK